MGCSQSKIENEEAVSRCKDRKLHMKHAVTARNAFAAAHTGYAMCLKNTGAALSDYAHEEIQPSQQGVSSLASTPFDKLPPPPPPLPNFSYTPLQRAASLPERLISNSSHHGVGPIIEEEDEDEIDDEESVGRLRRRRSSRGSAGAGSSAMGNRDLGEEVEGLPPPVPPSPSRTPPPSENRYIPVAMPQNSTYDYFFSVENMPSSSLSEPDEVNADKNEIERKAFVEKPKKMDGGDAGGRKGKAEAAAPLPEKTLEAAKKGKQVGVAGPAEGKRIVEPNDNFLQIFVELDDHFLKASESAHEVSKMLEATRLHYHSNFADNRGHIDHSARVMRVITWNRSFTKMPNMDDGKDDFDAEEHETHATVLDKLLAWEKKLYDEVKAGEVMKIEYQRKINTLNKMKKRGSNTEALEKAKAAVSHLHTRFIVDLQSMDSTVAEINRLRDQQLYPKLVQLIDGMAVMWETMQSHHAHQLKIVDALRFFDLSHSQSPKETSVHHLERTSQLWAVVQEWHSQFNMLVGHQKNYIKSLSNWLKLNLVPIESSLKEKVSSPPRVQPPIHRLLLAWQDHLEKLPDARLRTTIVAFDAVMNSIRHDQEDEMKLKMKCEETRQELSRKNRLYKDWHDKYMHRKKQDGVEENTSRDIVAEKEFALETMRKRLKEEEQAHLKQSRKVRDKSLASLKSQLPELFRALSEFSSDSSEMYKSLSSVSQHQSSFSSPA